MASVELKGLGKRYGDAVAVDDVSLLIEHGQLVCLLGPSGCGKTTTLRLIAGFIEPSAGEIVVGGKTPELPNARLKELGFAGVLYANTALQASLYGMQRALGHLKGNGQMGEAKDMLVGFAERQRLVNIAAFQAAERKYKA